MTSRTRRLPIAVLFAFAAILIVGCNARVAEKSPDQSKAKKPAPNSSGATPVANEAKVENAADPTSSDGATDPAAPDSTPSKPDDATTDEGKTDEIAPDKSKPTETATADADQPAGENDLRADGDSPLSSDEATEAKSAIEVNPLAPRPNLPPDSLVQFIVDRLSQPPSAHGDKGSAAGIVEAADRLLASDKATDVQKELALNSKFKALHDASVAGDKWADAKLLELANASTEYPTARAAAYVRLVKMERRLIEAERLPVEQIPGVLADVKNYLDAENRITNEHLHMATLTVAAIERLEDKKRSAQFDELGKLYAKSMDRDLRMYGERLGKPPEVEGGELAGKPMELVGKTTDGEDFGWDLYRGKVVVVDFWATWCGPCVAEIPHVADTYARLKNRGFEVVGVSLDADPAAVRLFLEKKSLPWPTLVAGSNQQIATRYGVRAIPTMFLIDRQGNIVARAHRIAELEKQIIEQLEKKDEPNGEPTGDEPTRDEERKPEESKPAESKPADPADGAPQNE